MINKLCMGTLNYLRSCNFTFLHKQQKRLKSRLELLAVSGITWNVNCEPSRKLNCESWIVITTIYVMILVKLQAIGPFFTFSTLVKKWSLSSLSIRITCPCEYNLLVFFAQIQTILFVFSFYPIKILFRHCLC